MAFVTIRKGSRGARPAGGIRYSVYGNRCRIAIGPELVTALGVQAGDCIGIAYDRDTRTLRLAADQDGFKLQTTPRAMSPWLTLLRNELLPQPKRCVSLVNVHVGAGVATGVIPQDGEE